MRILKNILIYALPALMLCNTSCDYLDKEPENKVPEENVDFTQIENMYQDNHMMYCITLMLATHILRYSLVFSFSCSFVRLKLIFPFRLRNQSGFRSIC